MPIFKPKKLSHHFLSSYVYLPFLVLPFTPSVFAQTVHGEELDAIDIFSSSFFSASELQHSNKLTLDSDDLNHSLVAQRSNNLAETLTHISGVQNNSFGPNNGMVQIRSLTNTRVAINEDGTTTSNLAAISGHLPVNINPRNLKNITVHKSSAAVLYGGNAIGGAVTSESLAIPKVLPEKNFFGEVEVSGGDNTPDAQFVNLNGKKGHFVWHIDGTNSQISHYKSVGNPKADACYDTKNIYRMTIDKNGNELGMGRNDPLLLQCQLQAMYSDSKFNIHSRPLINKEYLAALQSNNVQAYFDKYGLDSGSLKDLYKDPAKLPKWNQGDNGNLVYKSQAQFDALPPEQQKFIIDRKWGYIFIPNYNRFANNPDYIEGSPEETQDFLGVKDLIPVKNGRIPNSHSHLKNINIGGSYIDDDGYIGISAHHFKKDYGVPGFAQFMTATGDAHYLKPVNIRSEQNKVQLEASRRLEHPFAKNINT